MDALESYTEISPSGRGLHILVKAALPEHVGRKQGAVEIYDAQRYFAVTGERLAGTPATSGGAPGRGAGAVRDPRAGGSGGAARCAARPVRRSARSDAEVVAKALAAANGAKFQALWSGDLSAYTRPPHRPARSEPRRLCAVSVARVLDAIAIRTRWTASFGNRRSIAPSGMRSSQGMAAHLWPGDDLERDQAA